MELHEIKRADCSIKENRIKLLKEVMRVLKLTEKPSLSKLEKISDKLGRKYNMRMKFSHNIIIIYVEGGYSLINCESRYEAYLKHILYIREYNRLYARKS